jgi:uncharacterized membrane protein
MEAAGVAVIVLGALFALGIALHHVSRHGLQPKAYHMFRTRLGRSILLGLELLVAADIIGTVAVEPTVQNLLVLALIVLIRTFLSISLEVEIDGYWPWQKARLERERRAQAGPLSNP